MLPLFAHYFEEEGIYSNIQLVLSIPLPPVTSCKVYNHANCHNLLKEQQLCWTCTMWNQWRLCWY